jgi:hypothetical protein
MLKRAGISGERGLVVHEGVSSAAGQFGEFAGDVIPGAELLLGKSRRIVVVTDHNVHLFEGNA